MSTPTGTLDYLRDRQDPRTAAALTVTCSICKAKPGQDCRNPGPRPHLNRVVHLCRAEAWMDK